MIQVCRSVPASLARRAGIAAEPPAARWLIRAVVAVAIGAVTISLVFANATAGQSVQAHWLAVAAAAMALAQLFRLTFRTPAGSFLLGWGEAAIIICLHILPPLWVPVAVAAGCAVAQLLLYVYRATATLALAIVSAATVTVAGTAAALTAAAIAPTYQRGLDPAVASALGAAAAVYFILTVGLASATTAVRRHRRFAPIFVQTLRAKLIMVLGNVGVGCGIIALHVDWRFILLLTPGFWLLQQLYAHRLRADEERHVWHTFAAATRALNQLEEREVAIAGVRGAQTLFAAARTEVVVFQVDGPPHRYIGTPDGSVEHRISATADEFDGEYTQVARALVVGSGQVGEVRLTLRGSVGLTPRQAMTFSSYCDALAAALHDAVTNRELAMITARRTFEAAHDLLTGLPNRAAMLARGDEMLRRLDRTTHVALLLLDIDQFKEVNDTLGHAAGDDLLRTTAQRLTAQAHAHELVARLGGDEFALLLTGLVDETSDVEPNANSGVRPIARHNDVTRTPLRQALRRARQLIEHLAVPTDVAGLQLSVEASIGVVVAPSGSVDMSELLRRADVALYQAKRGGARVQWYDSAKDAASTDRLALLAELRDALAADDQLILALQPAVDLATGAPTGVEALVRWRHPRRGLLGPGEFVRAVEGSELLGAFTRHVIDRALGLAAAWSAQGLDVPISVNMSPRSLLDPHLPADVGELLRRHRVTAHRLVLEITETVVLSELDVIDEVLAGLRDLGVQLAVDDFGTGYSSLTFLTRIPVDEVKIDRAFVAKMIDSPEAAAIVRATVALGNQLGLRVVAEGVETDEQRKLLTGMGCHAGQGFRFFPPMPAEKVVDILRAVVNAPARVIPLRADGA